MATRRHDGQCRPDSGEDGEAMEAGEEDASGDSGGDSTTPEDGGDASTTSTPTRR